MRAFYDAVALSTHFGSLVTAALLAKRGFRVLVVRHDAPTPQYEAGGRWLPRGPRSFVAADTPIARRVFHELAVHQTFRQRAVFPDPSFQLVTPGTRFEYALPEDDLRRECEREFPGSADAVLAFLDGEAAFAESFDRAFDPPPPLPARGFFDTRRLESAFSSLPAESLSASDPLARLPEDHPFRLVLYAPLRFADAMDPDHAHPLRARRAFWMRARGTALLDDPDAGITELLIRLIRTHKGEVFERDRVDRILVDRRGRADGIRIAASGTEIGAGHIIVGAPLGSVLPLVPDRRPFDELFEALGEPTVRYYRYVLNVVVRPEVVPVAIARSVFFVRDPTQPLSGANCLHVETLPQSDGARTLTVEALLPRRFVEESDEPLTRHREAILESLRELVPFLDEHILLIDSPHDGRPARTGEGVEVPPSEPWSRGPQTMTKVYGYPVTTGHGLAAFPTRLPIERLLLANDQVVPGLGVEGTLLAAWQAAELIAKTDSREESFRTGLFRWLRPR